MIVCVTGSPGTGKSTLAKILMDELDYPVLDVNKFIKLKKLSEGYDRKRKCKIIDTKKLSKEILKEINKQKASGYIIDSHLSQNLPSKKIDICIVTKCDLKELEKRLKKRKYDKEKIRENLDCEIFDIILNEAKEMGHYTFTIDTTKGIKRNALLAIKGEIDVIQSASN